MKIPELCEGARGGLGGLRLFGAAHLRARETGAAAMRAKEIGPGEKGPAGVGSRQIKMNNRKTR